MEMDIKDSSINYSRIKKKKKEKNENIRSSSLTFYQSKEKDISKVFN